MIPLLLLITLISPVEREYRTPYDTHGRALWEFQTAERTYDDNGILILERSWQPGTPTTHAGRTRQVTRTGPVLLEQIHDTEADTITVTAEQVDSTGTTHRCRITWGSGSPTVTMSTVSGTVERTAGETITRYTNSRGQTTTERHEVNGSLAYKVSMTYDGRGSVASRLVIGADGKGLMRQEWAYTYDAEGRWATRTERRTYFDPSGRTVTIPVMIERTERE